MVLNPIRRIRSVAAVALVGALLAACSTSVPISVGPPGGSPTSRPSTLPSTAPSVKPSQGGGSGAYGGVKLPASDFKKNTWGYVGCSNTHDTISGYEQVPGNAGLFWPFLARYGIEGHVVFKWADPNNGIWNRFDNMKQTYNGGQDPPVIWVQLCENIGVPGRDTFGETTFAEVKAELANLKAHSPTSVVFLSPLQTYQPLTLCDLMGPGGVAVSDLTKLANQAVDAGLAYAGPGVGSNAPLGPLTAERAAGDGCHPNGNVKHGPGTGSEFLGAQLSDFIDNVPKS